MFDIGPINLHELFLYFSSLRRMVLIRIESREGRAEGEIQQALQSPDTELSPSLLYMSSVAHSNSEVKPYAI